MPTKTLTRRPRADRARAVRDVDELTPIDWHDGIAYKRDDLLLPFDDIDLSGGKVRQSLQLVRHKLDEIRQRHSSTLLTATGVHSPQGLIVARCAAHFELRCVVFIGATTRERALSQHRLMRETARFADIDDSTKIGYETAMRATVDKHHARHGGYVVRFGMNLDDDASAIVGSTAAQCRNVPPQITTVVIPVGAGITAAGVIDGVRTYCPNVDRIVCVQIAGYDRRKTIDRITRHHDYDFVSSTAYPYARLVRRWVAPGFLLDPIYEAKAHEYMTKHLQTPRGATLFWVIGNSAFVR